MLRVKGYDPLRDFKGEQHLTSYGAELHNYLAPKSKTQFCVISLRCFATYQRQRRNSASDAYLLWAFFRGALLHTSAGHLPLHLDKELSSLTSR